MRFLAAVLTFMGFATGACAGRQQGYEPIYQSIKLVGSVCPSEGPSVVILGAQHVSCGKGDTCTVLDQRVRNSTGRALWLLIDESDLFSQRLDAVSILTVRHEPRTAVWRFEGEIYNLALRVPAGADVVVRNFTYRPPKRPFQAVFLDRISVGQNSDIGTLAASGLIPLRGEIDLDGIGGFIARHDHRNLARFEKSERVAINVWCVQDVPMP